MATKKKRKKENAAQKAKRLDREQAKFDAALRARDNAIPLVEVKRTAGEPRRDLRAMAKSLGTRAVVKKGRLFVRGHFTALAMKHSADVAVT